MVLVPVGPKHFAGGDNLSEPHDSYGSGRPEDRSLSELVNDITDMVNFLELGAGGGVLVTYVDGGRADTYTPDGSMAKPYKLIQDGIDNCPENGVIKVRPGDYPENRFNKGCILIFHKPL